MKNNKNKKPSGAKRGAGSEGPRPRGAKPEVAICAIGASAGGVAALTQFFSAIDDNLGLAYVVVMHLAPDHPSELDQILAQRTSMPVHQVADRIQIEPNCVYVIPPDRELVIEGDDIQARPFSDQKSRYAPIDVFFRSVAKARGDGLAVVLSGSGADGATGVRHIKERGGVVLAQSAAEAEFPMMPRNAVATGAVDLVGTIEDIIGRIRDVMRTRSSVSRLDDQDSYPGLQQIVAMLRSRTGHDFSRYKRATILRRVIRRMQINRQDTLAAYIRFLQDHPGESQELFSDLLISVTNFFRDPAAFRILSEQAMARLMDRLDENPEIRVWSVGCATGEEAHSLGMMMLEAAGQRGIQPSIQIFASDIDDHALAFAREGRYPVGIKADVSPERLKRFFIEDNGFYEVKKELRDLVLFASHSALKDPPFINIDLIVCRNLLIYLQRDIQQQLNSLFHYALKPGGFLFLGSAETADATPSLFSVLDREARLYIRQAIPQRVAPVLPQLAADRRFLDHIPKAVQADSQPERASHAHATALESAAPPSVLVDDQGRILHLSATAGRFFLPSEGTFTSDLAAQVRPELRIDLKLALQRALEKGEETLSLPLCVAFNGHRRLVSLLVRAVDPAERSASRKCIVFFLDGGDERKSGSSAPEADTVEKEELQRLRRELTAAQDRLAASAHSYEQATQDLRAANEELQSINEEYRSTAEELETSKEELQSINEELQTVNAELKSKLEAISTAHNDLQNLMAASEVGTLFLDTDLRIKLFTPATTVHFNITQADIGRHIADFTHRLVYDGLEKDAQRVLDALVPQERELKTRDERWLIMRMRPYRTIEDRIEGVVATFTDITDLKVSEKQQRMAREFAESIVDTVRDPLLVLNPDMTVRTANDPFYREFGVSPTETEGRRLYDLGNGQWNIPELRRLLEHVLPANNKFRDFEVTHEFESIGTRTMLLNGRRLDSVQLVLLAIEDITERKKAQDALRLSEERMQRVLETDAVGVLFFDDDGRLVGCNDAFLAMTGYERREVDGRSLSWREMTPAEWIAESERQWEILKTTGRLGPYEKKYICKDETHKWMLFAGRRIEKNLVAEYCIDITDRKNAEAERELLAHELSHRVKNTLGVVQALAIQSGGDTIESFREAFLGRLEALASAHSLLLATEWGSARLLDLVERSMEAYRTDGAQRMRIEGPDVLVSPKQALGLSLVLHELGTNALKYGALSNHTGTVEIVWEKDDTVMPSMLRLNWRERGGPPVDKRRFAPDKKGFGSQLIERAIDYELGGTTTLTYPRAGLECKIVFPLT